jgi:hypothetical protein
MQKLWMIVSLIIGMYLSVATWHWALFLFGALILSVCIYFAGVNIAHIPRELKLSHYKSFFKRITIVIILLVLTFATWIAVIGSGVFTGMPIPHLRTNILTDTCSLNTSNDIADPWFYKRGCSVPKDEKNALLQNDYRFSFIQQQCENSQGDNDFSGWLNWDEVTCSDLLK